MELRQARDERLPQELAPQRIRLAGDPSRGRRGLPERRITRELGSRVPGRCAAAVGAAELTGQQLRSEGQSELAPRVSAAGTQLAQCPGRPRGAHGEPGRDRIATEELVGTLPVEQHHHTRLARRRVHPPLGVYRERADGLLVVAHEPLQVRNDLLRPRLYGVVLHPAGRSRHLCGVRPLVALEPREAGGESVAPMVAAELRRQHHDDRRVEPAA
jgi:hypothetical protein